MSTRHGDRRRLPARSPDPTTTSDLTPKGHTVYSLNEALSRERQRSLQQDAARHRLGSELAAVYRWRSLERRATAARERHLRRAAAAGEAVSVRHA